MRVLVWLSIFLPVFCLPTVSIDLPVSGKLPATDLLQTLCIAEPRLGQITYSSDSTIAPAEFFYLIDLKPNEIITAERVTHALANLARKRKFRRVDLALEDKQDGTADMHIGLVSYWTFDRLHIKGIHRHKDRLAHLYEQQPSMPFDEQSHAESMKKIIAALREQGYLAAKISDELVFDEKHRSVSVKLHLDRGRHYKIALVVTKIKDQAGHDVSTDERFADAVAYIKQLQGKKYDGASIAEFTKTLKQQLEQLGYLHPAIHMAQHLNRDEYAVALQFTVQLTAHHQFIFSGNTFFPTERLLNVLNAFGAMHEPPAALLAAELERLYRAHGFSDAQVEIKETPQNALVEIIEGERAKIQMVNIQTVDTSTTSSIKHDLAANSFYETELVQRSIETVMNQFRTLGYWDVAKIDQQFDVQSGTLGLTFDEGPRYYLRTLTIEQFPELVNEPPFSLAAIGEPLDYGLLQQQRTFLTNYLHSHGYMYAEAHPSITISSKRDVDLAWQIRGVSQPVHFGKTIVPGTCPIPFKDLRHQLAFEEGDVWSKEKMEQSVARLRDLQIFSSIHLYPEDVAVPAAEKTIMLNLVPDDPFEFRLRAGALGISKNFIWTQGVTYKVGGTFLYKNVGRRGGILGADADVTGYEQRVSGYYRHPWLWGKRITTLTKGYSNKYIQPVMIGRRLPLYIVTQQGGLLGITHKHRLEIPWIFTGEHALITIGANVGFEWVKTTMPNFNDDDDARIRHARAAIAINFSPALDGVKIPYFYVEPTVVIDRMDDKLNPTRGTFTVASVKCVASCRSGNYDGDSLLASLVEEHAVGLPENLHTEGNLDSAHAELIEASERKNEPKNSKNLINPSFKPGASSFIKFLIEHSWYVPIRSAVFAFRIRAGHVFNQRFSQIMPPERFYLGGPQTLRGYQPDFVPPLGRYEEVCRPGVDPKDVGRCVYVPQGGRTMVNLNAEIRFPLPLLQKFSGAIFQDAGGLFGDDFVAFIKERFVTATGFGIRYNTPIGPLRFDVGIKWRAPHEHEHRVAWYLALGHAF